MPASAQEGFRGLANQDTICVKDLNFANNFVGPVFAYRDGDVRIFSHRRIVS